MFASVIHRPSTLFGFNVWALDTIAITTLASPLGIQSFQRRPFQGLSGLDAASKTQRPYPDRTLGKKCRQRLRPCCVGDNKRSLLDPNFFGYSRFCFQPCPGCLTPSWLTYLSSPSFFSALPLFIWPVGFPPFLSCSLEPLLSCFSLWLPSLRLLFSALPGCHGDPKWSALLVRHGDPKWSAALPTVPSVLDSLWLTSLSVEHSGPVSHINHWNTSALLRLCFDVFLWLVFSTPLSFNDPTPSFFSWPSQLADRPCSTPVLLSWWSRFECLAAPRIRHLTAFLSGLWGGFSH